MIRLLSLAAVLLVSSSAFAGNESGGGGVLTRLLIASQQYLREELPRVNTAEAFPGNPELRALYRKISRQVADDVKQIKFTGVTGELRDPHLGYKTWIRIRSGAPMMIEYDPDPTLYLQLVDSRLQDPYAASGAREETPRLRDVMAFLLHEMGHFYGLKEEQAWQFAFGLQHELDLRSAARLKKCVFSYADPMIDRSEYLQKDFTMGGMDSILLTTRARVFSFAHVFKTGARPQLALSVTNSSTKSVELSLFIGADSQISLMQTVGQQNGFINLQCELTEATP